MSIDMEHSRDGYRGRYRDRHNDGSSNRNNHDERTTRGNYRGHPSHSNDHNGNYSSRSSPNSGYNYRSSRPSLNSRPISSRNGPSTHYRHPREDDYPLPSHLPSSSSSNRTSSGNSGPSNYYDNHSPSSRFDRPSNHRETYPSLLGEQPILSNGPPPPSSLYYPSSQPIPLLRDRALPVPPSQYINSERNRYAPSSSTYRRDTSPPPAPSYRNERSIDYGSRNTSNDIFARGEYQPPTSPLSTRGNPYGSTYRTNDYNARSERYEIPSNRTNTSARDYPMPSSTYRNDLYRSSSNVSMPSPSSYITREQYPPDVNYRPISQSRDYENTSSSSSRNSSMDHQDGLSRNSRDRNHNEYHSSHRDRPNLKRPGSRYDDNGSTPSKRPMRR